MNDKEIKQRGFSLLLPYIREAYATGKLNLLYDYEDDWYDYELTLPHYLFPVKTWYAAKFYEKCYFEVDRSPYEPTVRIRLGYKEKLFS